MKEDELNLQNAPEGKEEESEEEAEVAEEETEETTASEEEVEEEEEGKPSRKTGAEKRIDELTAKRRQAERDADYWRNEAMRKDGEPPKPGETPETITRPKPDPSQYESYDEFNEALVDWKIEQKESGRRAAQEKTSQEEKAAQFQVKLNEGFEKHEDFAEVALNRNVPINQNMVNAMFDCDHASDIAYHLGLNPQEARRIASLSPIATAREIGKLDAQFSKPKLAQKSTTKAGDSTKPVGGHEGAAKKEEDMTTDEWIAYKNRKEQGQKE